MIRAATEEEIATYAKIMGYSPSRSAKGVAFLASESISALCLYDHWTHSAVQVHVYASDLRDLFNLDYLHEIFRYPFETGNCQVLVSATPADHKASLAVSAWLGFKEILQIADGWKPGVPMVVKQLRREDCRFWPEKVSLTGT